MWTGPSIGMTAVLTRLRDEWNDLLRRSRFDTVFLTWEWQSTWWQHLGRDGACIFWLRGRTAAWWASCRCTGSQDGPV